VVILGAGYAGQIAAGRLAQRRLPLRITVVDASPAFVERVRMHQVMAGQRLRSRPMRSLLPAGVAFRHARATAWDVSRRTLTIAGDDGVATVAYDRLVYALGSVADTAGVPGVTAHALTLGGQADAERLARAVAALGDGARVLVVGGGLTALEAATELAESRPDLRVSMTAPTSPRAAFAPAGAAHVDRALKRLRVWSYTGSAVSRLEEGCAHLADGRTLPFELCLWATGFAAPPLAAAAGLPVNDRGQLLVDETLRVPGHPEILVAGDAADVRGAGVPLRMACATAMPMGVFAAEQLAREQAGRPARPFRFAYAIRCVSLGRRDGIVQRVGPDDVPRPTVLTGWRAALVKELVCRSTIVSMRLERRGFAFYRWPRPQRPPVGSPVPGAYARAE
jgi:NADH dehydrogenase FAD-containing subunit